MTRTFFNIIGWFFKPPRYEPVEPVVDINARFVVIKRVNGKDYYLRFCSTTGEPLWENSLTSETELYRTEGAAQGEIEHYFIFGVMARTRVERISLADVPDRYPQAANSYCGLKQ